MHLKRCLVVVLVLALMMGAMPAALAYSMPYYIHVDLTNQIVTIYNTSDNSVARQMLCSAGTGDRTPTGEWYMPTKERSDERTEWYWMPNAYTWVKYATKFYYAYFFHSIPYNDDKEGAINQTALEQFGTPASHGCIRLREEDAEFIAKECKAGTYVKIYRSGVEDTNLRALLYEGTYIQSEHRSYSEFLGFNENDLGRACTGTEVLDLQHRLKDLGYFSGEMDGIYGDETIHAVMDLQKELGLLTTGICSEALLSVIYAEHAPAKLGAVTVQEGQSGPLVEKLQTALKELALYDGEINGIYDVKVATAIANFQNICGVNADGVASPEIQHALYYALDRVHSMVGSDFTASYETEEMIYGTVTHDKANIVVREKASTESDRLGTVKDGDRVLVLAVNGDWAQIMGEAGTGFIYKKYLKNPETELNYIMKYTNGSSKSCTLGTTLAEKAAGSGSLLKEFKAAYSAGETSQYLHDSVLSFATVNTGSDEVSLNLRQSASSDSSVLDQASNGSSLRILQQGDEWSMGVYNSQIVYLLSQYLDFWTGEYADNAEVVASQQKSNDAPSAAATVVINDNSAVGAKIYAASAETSSIFARVPADLELKVVSFNAETGWALVEYSGNQGFMRAETLNFK